MRLRMLQAWLVLPLLSLLMGCGNAPPAEESPTGSAALADKNALYYQKRISLSADSPVVGFTFHVKKWGILPADIIYSLFNVSAPSDEVATQRDELTGNVKIPIGTIAFTPPGGRVKAMALSALPEPTGSGLRLFLDDADEFRSTWAADGDYGVAIEKSSTFFSSLSVTFNATWQPFQP